MLNDEQDATLEITPFADQAGELRYSYIANLGNIIEVGWLQDGNEVSEIIREFRKKTDKSESYLHVRMGKIREGTPSLNL